MSNAFFQKINEIMAKTDKKVLEAKINGAIELLKKGEKEKLVEKLGKIDKEELMSKIDQFDISNLEKLNINKDAIKSSISENDLEDLSKMLGDGGDKIIEKLKSFLQ